MLIDAVLTKPLFGSTKSPGQAGKPVGNDPRALGETSMTAAAQQNQKRTRRWPVFETTPPHFAAQCRNGQVSVTGDTTCSLGNEYETTSGRPAGVFASWSWDGETLVAEVDPFGYFNLFFFANGKTVGVSPSLLQLIADGADTTLDHRALAVFYRLGLFINDDTPFKNIRVLPPGGRLTWRNGEFTVTGGPTVPQVREISRQGAVDGFIDLARQSMTRILDVWTDDIVLPLSGGRDSRHILLEMQHLGRLPKTCVTFHHGGRELNSEARAARAVCESVGVSHTILGHPRSRSRDILRTLILTSLCSDEHAQMMPLHDYLADQPCAALDGIAGDILTNPDDSAEEYFQLASRGDYAGIAQRMIAGHGRVISQASWGRGAGPLYAPGRDDEAIDYIGTAIQEYASAPDPYQAFWFWSRTRREIGLVPTSMFGSAAAIYCPYLDPEFVEFGLSLPYRVTRDQQLHNDAIAKAYPAHRHVPFQEGFRNLPHTRPNPFHKITSALDGISMLLAIGPEKPFKEAADFLRGSKELHRSSANIYRMHALCLESLDAEKAKRLLALNARLHASRSRDLVTDTYLPRKLAETTNGI